MARLILAISVFLIFTSCKQSAQLTENDKAGIKEQIKKMLNDYREDVMKFGLTAEFKYLDSSTNFFWVPPEYSSSISYDSVVAVLKQNAPKYKRIANSFDTLQIIPLNREIATYTGRLNSTMTDTSGKTMTLILVETGVVIKRKDGWKLLSGQTSVLNH